MMFTPTGTWRGVPYLPPEKLPPAPDMPMMFDLQVLLFVICMALIGLILIGLAKARDAVIARRKHKEARLKFNKGLVPGWVFRDEDSMRLWLRLHMGVEPEQWRIDMLMALYEARVNAMKRASIGKGYTLVQIKEKIVNGEEK